MKKQTKLPLLDTNARRRSRKGKLGMIRANIVFALPMTGNKDYDRDWFNFINDEMCKVSRMKKRNLNKYYQHGFIRNYIKHCDKYFTKTSGKLDTNKYLFNVCTWIESRPYSKDKRNPAIYHLFITLLNRLITLDPTKYDRNSVIYWKSIREKIFKLIRILESKLEEKVEREQHGN